MTSRAFASLTIIILSTSCQSRYEPGVAYQVTPIPFNINNLTDDQRRVIREGHESDTSNYLVRSRPVLFQIVEAGNNADETRGPARFDQEVDVLIYGLGEVVGDQLVDYGWLENVTSGQPAWEMTPTNTVHAGGDPSNRKRVTRMMLSPGEYRLRYRSNASHAYPDWSGNAPEYAQLYGVTLFNMTALPGINERLRQAGAPPLGDSLNRHQ